MTNPELPLGIDLQEFIDVREHGTTSWMLFLNHYDIITLDYGDNLALAYDNEGEAYVVEFEPMLAPMQPVG